MSETLPADKMRETNEYVYEEENQLMDFLNFINEYFELEKKWQHFQTFVMDHPVASLFLIVTFSMCSVPVIFFGMFVFGTLAVSLVGFLIFEGTALTIGTLVLAGCLFMAGLLSVGFATFLLTGYYVLRKCLYLFGAFKDKLTSPDILEPDTVPSSSSS